MKEYGKVYEKIRGNQDWVILYQDLNRGIFHMYLASEGCIPE